MFRRCWNRVWRSARKKSRPVALTADESEDVILIVLMTWNVKTFDTSAYNVSQSAAQCGRANFLTTFFEITTGCSKSNVQILKDHH
jgi:hypothetical protein